MKPESQNVTDYPNHNTSFLVWNFKENADIQDAFQKVCKLVINLNHSSEIRFPDSKNSCVIGIGRDAWKRLELPDPLPKELKNFAEIKGAKHTAVSTKGDLHFHLRAVNPSFCYDMASEISDILNPVATASKKFTGSDIGTGVRFSVLWTARKIRPAKNANFSE